MAVILVSFRPWRECLHVGRNFRGRFSSHRTCSVWEAHDRHEPQAQVSPVRRWARENATRALAAVGSRLQPARRGRPDGQLAPRAVGRCGPLATRRHRRRHPARALDALRRRPRLSHPAAGIEQAAVRRGAAPRPGDAAGADPARPAGDVRGLAPAGARVALPQAGLRHRQARAAASAPTGSARSQTTGPGSGSSSRATSSIAPARSRPAARWPCSTTCTSASPGRAAMS